jgi:hypothetical protein
VFDQHLRLAVYKSGRNFMYLSSRLVAHKKCKEQLLRLKHTILWCLKLTAWLLYVSASQFGHQEDLKNNVQSAVSYSSLLTYTRHGTFTYFLFLYRSAA